MMTAVKLHVYDFTLIYYTQCWVESIMMKVAFDRSNIGESMCVPAELHKIATQISTQIAAQILTQIAT